MWNESLLDLLEEEQVEHCCCCYCLVVDGAADASAGTDALMRGSSREGLTAATAGAPPEVCRPEGVVVCSREV